MSRQRKQRKRPLDGGPTFHYRPFAVLGQMVQVFEVRHQTASKPLATSSGKSSEGVEQAMESDTELFWKEMADVVPLDRSDGGRVERRGPAWPPRAPTSEDAEALAELCDLVGGHGTFDVTFSDEHVEGVSPGLDIRLLRRLRRGEFAYQGYLDLHGCTWDEAKARVDSFLGQAVREGKRCVLIIHGRGRNSKDQVPVLKSRLTTYLSQGRWSRLLLAFCSARPVDGGVGAVYVLLRRQRGSRGGWRVGAGVQW